MAQPQFDVEHALLMHAYSYITRPAAALYDKERFDQVAPNASRCHIYLIGFLPVMNIEGVHQHGNVLTTELSAGGVTHKLDWELGPGDILVVEDDLWYVRQPSGQRIGPSNEQMVLRFHQMENLNFEVQYIGQAYGKDGSRNALDRLLKHETLQKIAVKGLPAGKALTLLLLEIVDANRTLTIFRPDAVDSSQGEKRTSQGISKLFGTTEQERVTLYEASLIRYFQPEFNKEFKHSFPSTNMKVLNDCYEKNFAGVVAEINFDDMPFSLCSTLVTPQTSVIAKYSFHTAEERNMFFRPDGNATAAA